MRPWSWLLLPTLCLLPTRAAPRRGAPAPARCELKPQQSELNSFLWTIKRDPPSYFFGTIHVPYTRVWDFIPDNSKEAFQQSSIVYFELDLTDPYTISALTSCQMLPQGKNLQDVLPRDIYCRLKHHLEYVKLMMPSWMTPDQRGKGLYADYLFNAIVGNWERKRPIWVMLMVNSLTEVDIKSRGVPVLDLYLAQEAERLRKQTGVVEKVEEQCHPLNGLNFSQVIFALNQTLLQQESLRAGSLQVPYTTEDLIKQYNCGDLSSVIFSHDSSQVPNFINATLPPQERITAQEIDSYFRQELIYKRNERMGKRVKALLEEFPDKGFFFAFGAERRVNAPHCHPSPLPSLLRKYPPWKRGYRKLHLRCTHCCHPTRPCPEVPTCLVLQGGSSGRSGGGRSGGSSSGSSVTCGSDWKRVLWCHSSRSLIWTVTSPPSCGPLRLDTPTAARWWPAVPPCLSGLHCFGCWFWLSKQRHPSCSDWRSQAKTLAPWTEGRPFLSPML
ncbi:metalloprotease TIKI1 isoform 2-T2 [Glossophaga mutica]